MAHDHDHTHSHCQHQHPATVTETLSPQDDETITVFKVTGMDCADEVAAIKHSLNHPDISKVQANLISATVTVLHRKILNQQELIKKINSSGVKVQDQSFNNGVSKNDFNYWIWLVGSGLFLALGFSLLWGFKSSLASTAFILSILVSSRLVLPKAVRTLRRKQLDMNVLVVIATLGAIFISEYSEASTVIFLFAVSEWIESLSVQKTRKAISQLLKLNSFEDFANIKVGESLQIKSGSLIPLDGTVQSGSSTVNQAALTGESLPVFKTVGDQVFAGTLNLEGTIKITVTHDFKNTRLSRILKLVEESHEQKAQSQKLIDRFAHYYTPIIFILALLTFLLPPLVFAASWNEYFYKALVLLVIGCPCALVISTPIAIVSSLTSLARNGVLVKGGIILEKVGQIKTIAFDKTGTLTESQSIVKEVIPFLNYAEADVLKIATTLESFSTHPIAKSIINYAATQNITADEQTQKFNQHVGLGVEAMINSHYYIAGGHEFLHRNNLCTPELEEQIQSLEAQALRVVCIGHLTHDSCAGEVIGLIVLTEKIKDNAKKTLKSLLQNGMSQLVLLSGDQASAVKQVAEQLDLTHVYSQLMPEDKLNHIKRLQQENTQPKNLIAMVGDGINDAPSLAAADVSIALGLNGTDVAIETADIVLMNDDLSQINTAISASRRTLRIIWFNISFAIGIKIIFLILNFFGTAHLWLAILADTGAALLVILNSLRLLRLKKNDL